MGLSAGNDHRLFEKICLEGFQAGLSWLTILRKRERFREVFHGFDPERVAKMTKRDVNRLVNGCRHHPPSRED
jgi:DNA-3-methyladenine glycosylase I